MLANNVRIPFSGPALGSVHALVALGFVPIVRATNVVHFAHGIESGGGFMDFQHPPKIVCINHIEF